MLNFFQIIILTVSVILFVLLINYIINKSIHDSKKRRVWKIISDILSVIIVSIVTLLILYAADARKEKKEQVSWIYHDFLEQYWEEEREKIVDEEYRRIIGILEEYSNNAIEKYEEDGDEESLENYLAASFWGLEDLYLLGSLADEKKREAQIEKFKNHFEKIAEELGVNMINLLSDDLSQKTIAEIDDNSLCRILMGTPESIAAPSSSEQYDIACAVMGKLFANRRKTDISSCSFDRKKKVWLVHLDNGSNMAIYFIKTTDDEYDIYAEESPDDNLVIGQDVLAFLTKVYPNSFEGASYENYSTARFLEYRSLECDYDPVYSTQDVYAYEILPDPRFSRYSFVENAYLVEWERFTSREKASSIVVLCKEKGNWKIDNVIVNGHLLFDYSRPAVQWWE